MILDDCTHFAWTFPLRHKSDVLATLISFHAYVATQFQLPILCFQTDNGKEFDNHACRSFLRTQGIQLRLTCPYTSPKNARAERVLRTLNDMVHTLLIDAALPLRFWPDALATATFLLNRRPCRTRNSASPFHSLFGCSLEYDRLRDFGCKCYPNTTSSSPHKLTPRSIPCVFIGYPAESKGYRCYDPVSRRILTFRHVLFDETIFPYREHAPAQAPAPSPTPPGNLVLVPAPAVPRRARHGVPGPQNPHDAPTAAPLQQLGAATASPSHDNHAQLSSPQVVTNPASTASPPAAPSASHSPSTLAATPSPASSPSAAPPNPTHHMVTRAKAGIIVPNPCYAHVATADALPSVPRSVRAAMRDLDWCAAMEDEFRALQDNRT
ncbi:retrotransposon protein, putative, unclassified [Panicum miliaceum]|uniref:Retrotransposon protein, putative, unclassified n=1 Tax=Panicum miliaceum TaxID=4540 RepID=A0A3L6S9D9_PANMI|nr:retrotransposon protein, putative, unclassified [Panicum miliaceum]